MSLVISSFWRSWPCAGEFWHCHTLCHFLTQGQEQGLSWLYFLFLPSLMSHFSVPFFFFTELSLNIKWTWFRSVKRLLILLNKKITKRIQYYSVCFCFIHVVVLPFWHFEEQGTSLSCEFAFCHFSETDKHVLQLFSFIALVLLKYSLQQEDAVSCFHTNCAVNNKVSSTFIITAHHCVKNSLTDLERHVTTALDQRLWDADSRLSYDKFCFSVVVFLHYLI